MIETGIASVRVGATNEVSDGMRSDTLELDFELEFDLIKQLFEETNLAMIS